VIGRVFWLAPTVHLLDGAQPYIALLEERDFIRRRGTSALAGDPEFVIKHALTREVAYASIPKVRRGRLHAAFAGWLESTDPGKDEHASLLAHHYAEAVRPADADLVWAGADEELERLRRAAVRWLRRAAELAGGRHEIDEGIELLERAVPLAASAAERAELWREAGMLNAARYDGAKFVAAMERSLAERPGRVEESRTMSVLALHASLRSGMWRERPAADVLEDWVDRALELADAEGSDRVRALVAKVHLDASTVSNEAVDALMLAESLEDDELLSYALEARANVAFERHLYRESMEWMEGRLALLPRLPADVATELLDGLVPAASAMGRFVEARRFADLHFELAARLSVHHMLHGLSLRLEIDEHRGDWTAIHASREEICEAVDRNLATPCVRNARNLLVCALAAAGCGDDAAAHELERGERELAMTGYDYATDAPRLRLALVRGDMGAAGELVQRAPARTFVFGAIAHAVRLDALVALGDREQAEECGVRLLEPGSYLEPFALRALGWSRRDDGLLERAQQRFAALGLDWYAEQTESLLRGL
jgi:hypothetical protein